MQRLARRRKLAPGLKGGKQQVGHGWPVTGLLSRSATTRPSLTSHSRSRTRRMDSMLSGSNSSSCSLPPKK